MSHNSVTKKIINGNVILAGHPIIKEINETPQNAKGTNHQVSNLDYKLSGYQNNAMFKKAAQEAKFA